MRLQENSRYDKVYKGMRSPLLDIEYNRKRLYEVVRFVKMSLGEVGYYVDLGSGDCELTTFVVNILNPANVICIDVNEQALHLCSSKGFVCIKADLNVDRIPLQDDVADVVTAFELIQHLWNKDHFLEEVFRILRDGGILYNINT